MYEGQPDDGQPEMADRAEADRGGSQQLLLCERGPIRAMVILNKSGKKLKRCLSCILERGFVMPP
jgi:hypothetical protein